MGRRGRKGSGESQRLALNSLVQKGSRESQRRALVPWQALPSFVQTRRRVVRSLRDVLAGVAHWCRTKRLCRRCLSGWRPYRTSSCSGEVCINVCARRLTPC